MSLDEYTMYAPLCDEEGMVSHEPRTPGVAIDPNLTYYQQLNNLRAHTGLKPYEGEPFQCTGSAHLAGHHIKCTSPFHSKPVGGVVVYPAGGTASLPVTLGTVS